MTHSNPPQQEPGPKPSSFEASGGPAAHRSRSRAALLGLLLGWAGLHRAYLRLSLWWWYPMLALPAIGWALRESPWFRQPGFFAFGLIVVVSLAETIVIALTSDERWDRRFNPGSPVQSRNGWAPVLIAIMALIAAVMLGMTTMALALEAFFMSRRS